MKYSFQTYANGTSNIFGIFLSLPLSFLAFFFNMSEMQSRSTFLIPQVIVNLISLFCCLVAAVILTIFTFGFLFPVAFVIERMSLVNAFYYILLKELYSIQLHFFMCFYLSVLIWHLAAVQHSLYRKMCDDEDKYGRQYTVVGYQMNMVPQDPGSQV